MTQNAIAPVSTGQQAIRINPTRRRVAVLLGGWSAERQVSLVSGAQVALALRSLGYEVTEIDVGDDFVERIKAARPDVCFMALHGRWGEDGCVQGALECLRIPYTHSGVLASAQAMDKERTKAVYRAHGLPVVESGLFSPAAISAGHVMPVPYVVKPYNEGSSVGVRIVADGANTPPQLDPATSPALLMVERFIPGRELTVAVMGERALCVTEIIATTGWYDYHAKYAPGGSRHVVPAEVPQQITEACLDYALRAHRALGLRGISRTDFRWDDRQPGVSGLFLLETNTQPGMTPTSLAPEQAQVCGISFAELCHWLIEDASCGR